MISAHDLRSGVEGAYLQYSGFGVVLDRCLQDVERGFAYINDLLNSRVLEVDKVLF
jgi:hypothetical protein